MEEVSLYCTLLFRQNKNRKEKSVDESQNFDAVLGEKIDAIAASDKTLVCCL
jgi:hypothetical protein